MHKKIAITGMGIISSIGTSVEENFQALISKKTGISFLENFDSKHASEIKVGEIKWTNEELIQQLNLPENQTFTRT
ncbi:MAG TPA: beta-ketoacyl synthase N-terminal-like domain-containing protein, partial [Flavobacterium sp.]|nr:beta-ketoacyl synthase N-terminal-like domain-containing protein [Flavobacterium sp.]